MSGYPGTPNLGSRISLISKAHIRYKGILYTIDRNNATVALAKACPPREEMDEDIIFQESDLKDITVCEHTPSGSCWMPPYCQLVASSLLSQQDAGLLGPMVGQAIQPGSLDNLNSKKLLPGEGSVGMQLNGHSAPPDRKATTDGAQRQPGKLKGSRPTNIKENTIKFEGNFDFERANVQFSREELDKEFKRKLNFKDDKAEKGEEKDLDVEDLLGPHCYYDKSKSFFDNISSELKTRGRGSSATHHNPTSHRAGTGRVSGGGRSFLMKQYRRKAVSTRPMVNAALTRGDTVTSFTEFGKSHATTYILN
ncbi:hypothetical protein FD754_017000 [Muntiacus muntjak]|uniref:DFDF domain-containing protein n=1 Tax=Muntiacus muntjak TaxID=9888 RepID=A0A5N3VSL7_MUNMU|nr:hypothetical protein FD754_017000 [Muntiacus muntjak]